ncbi:hypothetical protein COMA2_30198 [Candidatus Nitrospira nitrificans]|uniref:Uncharacterized protein n=1 Tax=Candidatus Nitrospira nitrificans TaxID=1742973 RepID=A0A0S4LKU7_9BACT|nr:hypothetical protein COMA2_30198 [Candidatus Nitrospira nitrificans]
MSTWSCGLKDEEPLPTWEKVAKPMIINGEVVVEFKHEFEFRWDYQTSLMLFLKFSSAHMVHTGYRFLKTLP